MNPRLTRQSRALAQGVLSGVLAGLMACGPSGRLVLLERRDADAISYRSGTRSDPVILDQAAFIATMADLARRAPVTLRPADLARDLLGGSLRPQPALVLIASMGSPISLRSTTATGGWPSQAREDLTREYGRWCDRRQQPGDCLGLLQLTPSLDADGRRTLGLAFAMESVWDETKDALRTAVDPVRVYAAIVCMMAVYLTLWLLPEPVSKGVAAVLTASLIAYLGIDTVWSLIQGWRQLARIADAATSFEELRAAGKAYGKVMGQNAARIFVMLATAAIAGTASMAARLPGLPGFAQAQRIGAAEGGFNIAAVGQIESVAIASEGTVTISLATAAVATNVSGGSFGPAPLKQFDIDRYGRFSVGDRVGDGLQGHELLQNAWLKEHGFVDTRGASAASRDNPAVALERDLHLRLNAEQRKLGLVDSSRLRAMTAEENIRLNAMAMRAAGIPEYIIQVLMREALAHAARLAK